MRHETCLNCKFPEATDANVQKMLVISETLGGLTHHHHKVECGGCGQWWFDDLVIGGLGIPIPNRRDTELCGCEDGLPQYTLSAIVVPQPEDRCACTKTEMEKFSFPVHMGGENQR